MAFEPIVNERLSDKIVQVIMEQITAGSLKPGDKLPNELELAESFRVSRGVVREAMTILQARNYIDRKPKDGTFVKEDIYNLIKGQSGISLKQATYYDMLEMRECIEQKAVEKIIDTATDAQLSELKELVDPIKKEEDLEKTSVDYYFHYKLAELSQNAMFVNFIDSYYDIIDELKSKTTIRQNRRDEIYNEHCAIIDAICSRDKEKAKEAVIYHLDRVRDNVKSVQ
jgi:GntR family transcriptional repressor for pyruvate dehydrogenase complex